MGAFGQKRGSRSVSLCDPLKEGKKKRKQAFEATLTHPATLNFR